MSIAVSANILPSRVLASMLACMFALANGAIGYTGFCAEINKTTILIIVCISSLLSLFLYLRYYRKQKMVRLDISDSGKIILRVPVFNSLNFESLNVKLLGRSTLWPQLMLLSLRSDDGQIWVLPILRDGVDVDTFRKLSIALNWVATHASSRTIFGADSSSGNF